MTFTAKCPECGRVFDMLDATDAQEWGYGHDCEPPEPRQGFQTGFGTIDPAAGPREGAVKAENASTLEAELTARDVPVHRVGQVLDKGDHSIVLS